MLRPARMVHLNVLVMDKDADRATTEMIKSGVVHLVSVTDLEPWAEETGLGTVAEEDVQALAQVEKVSRSIADKLGVGREVVSEALAFEPFDPGEAMKKLEQIVREVEPVASASDGARRKLAELQEARSRLAVDVRAKLGVDVASRYTLLEVVPGRMPEKNLEIFRGLLSDVPNVVLTFAEEKGKVGVLAIVLKRDRERLRKACEEVGVGQIPLPERKGPVSEEIIGQLEERVSEAEMELKKAEMAVEQCRGRHLGALRAILSQVSLQKLKGQARRTFRRTARTYLIAGWTPRRHRDEVVEGLRKACDNRCLIEEQNAEKILREREENVDVPILFENPKLLRPFEMLVSNYGRPTYNSIDPTVVVAPTFLLMYGLMFGDVGQGAVMAILGALVARWKRVSEGVRRIGELFTWCGGAGVLLGFVYGTFFGFRLFGGIEPLENVTGFMNFALFFGMGLISLGLVFNVVIAVTRRDWAGGILDRTGLMGLAFYWLAVAAAVQILFRGRISGAVIRALILIPVVAVFLREPIGKLLRPRRKDVGKGIGAYVARSIGEVIGTYFEAVLMFLSNTVSFLRMAAFAMAHAALFSAVFGLAEVLRGGAGGVPIVVHVLGNGGMIALEGLVVCVQALRLEYYEFFGKFYHTGGTQFAPTKLPAAIP